MRTRPFNFSSISIKTILFAGVLLIPALAQAAPCTSAFLEDVTKPATTNLSSIYVNCDLTLKSADVVTKRLILNGKGASNIIIDCVGATLDGGRGTINDGKDMIEIKSYRHHNADTGELEWDRPQNITVRNCLINGSVRIWGMTKNGEGTDLRDSSRLSGHVLRARNNAPTAITLDNLTITGTGRIPLYISPGVTYVTFKNSEIQSDVKSDLESVAVYLGAESYSNTIQGNYIHAKTGNGREVMAIDGSSYNRIINNRFSALNHGGIYLYRNCGQGRTIRHSTPSNNEIINNVFYYNKYNGSKPAIYIGSRNGHSDYCGDDDGYPYGSSVSNLDYARFNVIMQNQIYKRSVDDMIKVGGSVNKPNYINLNQTVVVAAKRPAGCYVADAYGTDFILHGQTVSVIKGKMGEPVCSWYGYTCNDGEKSTVWSPECSPINRVDFQCRVQGNNKGCNQWRACSSGTRLIGAVAACNLESGIVSDSQLAQIHVNIIKVVRESDRLSDGYCYIENTGLHSGTRTISDINERPGVSFGCKEHDKNGGDCHIKGALYCQ